MARLDFQCFRDKDAGVAREEHGADHGEGEEDEGGLQDRRFQDS